MGAIYGVLMAMILTYGVSEVGAEEPCRLTASGSGVVDQVIDGDTVKLAGGAQVRLVGTQAPKLPLGREGYAKWPLADEAKAKLEALILGKIVQLEYGGRRIDRHGRKLAHLFLETDEGDKRVWVQSEMIEAGMARVYSFADNRACLDLLLSTENQARDDKVGIWGDRFYDILAANRPGALVKKAASFQIVRGRTIAAVRRGSRIFINFDRDWKRDFTIVIPARNWKDFEKKKLTLKALTGAMLQVRGWISLWNGPMIEADHPEQIELIE